MDGEDGMLTLRSGKQLGKEKDDATNAQLIDLEMGADDVPPTTTPVSMEDRRPLGARPKTSKVYDETIINNERGAAGDSQGTQIRVDSAEDSCDLDPNFARGAALVGADLEMASDRFLVGARLGDGPNHHCSVAGRKSSASRDVEDVTGGELSVVPTRYPEGTGDLQTLMKALGDGIQGNTRRRPKQRLMEVNEAGLHGETRKQLGLNDSLGIGGAGLHMPNKSRPECETGRDQYNLGLLHHTPDEIHRMTPSGHLFQPTSDYQERAVSTLQKPTLKMKPPIYDGSTSWDDYLVQFELIAQLNGWPPMMWASYLAASLRGAAQAVLGDLDTTRRQNYKTLTASLNQRFGSANRTEMFRAILKTRVRQSDETLPALAQAVRRLVKQAYPTAPNELMDSLACDHFVDALMDSDTRWRIQQTRPQSLDQAVKVAVELEAFREADRQRGIFRKNLRSGKTVAFSDETLVCDDRKLAENSDGHHSQTTDMSLMDVIQSIERRLQNVEGNSRRPPHNPQAERGSRWRSGTSLALHQ